MKKVFYLTIDQLNASTAEALAARQGLALEVVEPRDLPRLGEGHLVLDWDFLPEALRMELLDGTSVIPVGVHGHNLGESLEGFLPERGVVWSRWLDAEFMRMLSGQMAAASGVPAIAVAREPCPAV